MANIDSYGAAPLAPLPPEVDSGFAQVLHVLNGSKVHRVCIMAKARVPAPAQNALEGQERAHPSACMSVLMGLLRMAYWIRPASHVLHAWNVESLHN